jgi:hypothetical protein
MAKDQVLASIDRRDCNFKVSRLGINPESAVENPLPSGAQSFRREDNALLPLNGLRLSVFLRTILAVVATDCPTREKTL